MPEGGLVFEVLRDLGLSEAAATTFEALLVRSLRVFLVVAVAWALGRFAAGAVRRALRSIPARAPQSVTSVRAAQRAATLGDVLASVARFLVWAVAFLVVLDEFGINLAPLLAGAGIAGIAVGFGAQSLVRDLLSGVLILAEDQYGVDDVVTLSDGVTGTVEDVTVRMTRLRAADGTVWFVPNGEIRRVGNSSMEWSRAVVDVMLSYDADLTLASSAVLEEARALAMEPEWAPKLLDPPELWGVQSADDKGITLRLVARTGPREQYALSRELRERVNERLRREGIGRPGQAAAVMNETLGCRGPDTGGKAPGPQANRP